MSYELSERYFPRSADGRSNNGSVSMSALAGPAAAPTLAYVHEPKMPDLLNELPVELDSVDLLCLRDDRHIEIRVQVWIGTVRFSCRYLSLPSGEIKTVWFEPDWSGLSVDYRGDEVHVTDGVRTVWRANHEMYTEAVTRTDVLVADVLDQVKTKIREASIAAVTESFPGLQLDSTWGELRFVR